MSWRTVVITGNAKLDYKMDYLIVRKTDNTTRVFIGEIGMLIIESTSVSLTTMLLCELTKHKVKVVFCDEKHNPQSELLSYYGSHDTSAKVRTQIGWSKQEKELIWTEIVAEKIRQQRDHLLERGLDTQAALNYGYGILLACFNREVVANGYITQLGLFHDNMFNRFNFSSDLMEPFRILVDRIVVKMKPQKFDKDEKICFIYMLEDGVMIDGKNQYVSNAIKIYCRSVFDALNDKDISMLKFYQVI